MERYYLSVDGGGTKTKMILCTVKDDLHDIGKNIVRSMLEAAGFEVLDLGIDVPASEIVKAAKENSIKIVALSGVLTLAIDSMQALLDGVDFDVVVGAESRGFVFGTPIAYNLHKPFVLVRKKGKLPCETISRSYDLEYGTAEIEMHKDSIKPGQRVVLVDDLIATGGTIEAAAKLVEELGGKVVKIIFLMELAGLKGRERLKDYDVASVIRYDGK